MGSRKYEKAAQNPISVPFRGGDMGTNGGFWKKNSIAIPGRPNPSKVSATFQDFEQSVSDVWDINEDNDATGRPVTPPENSKRGAFISSGLSSGGPVEKVTSVSDLAATFGTRRPSELSSQLEQMAIR